MRGLPLGIVLGATAWALLYAWIVPLVGSLAIVVGVGVLAGIVAWDWRQS